MGVADLAGKASNEVRELHAFFVAWFRGESRQSADFARCEAVLAYDFRMITPDGHGHDRAAVVARLRSARDSAPGDFAIEILQPHVAWRSDDAVLLEFIERQYRGGRIDSRRSTGLFTEEPAAPSGVLWRHVHETWVASGGEDTNQMRAVTRPRREA
jgi:hypothetical protein